MSAFVCAPEHLGALAWAAGHYLDEDASRVVQLLAKENIASVAHRYPSDGDGERPGPMLFDRHIIEAAKLYTNHYIARPPKLGPMSLINMCRCYEYQTCEHPDWDKTEAIALVRRLAERMREEKFFYLAMGNGIRVEWEFTDSETQIRRVEAMYRLHRMANRKRNPAKEAPVGAEVISMPTKSSSVTIPVQGDLFEMVA